MRNTTINGGFSRYPYLMTSEVKSIVVCSCLDHLMIKFNQVRSSIYYISHNVILFETDIPLFHYLILSDLSGGFLKWGVTKTMASDAKMVLTWMMTGGSLMPKRNPPSRELWAKPSIYW